MVVSDLVGRPFENAEVRIPHKRGTVIFKEVVYVITIVQVRVEVRLQADDAGPICRSIRYVNRGGRLAVFPAAAGNSRADLVHQLIHADIRVASTKHGRLFLEMSAVRRFGASNSNVKRPRCLAAWAAYEP